MTQPPLGFHPEKATRKALSGRFPPLAPFRKEAALPAFSSIGFGTSHFSRTLRPQCFGALKAALTSGINWLDVAVDFADGAALNELRLALEQGTQEGWYRREETIFVLRTPVPASLTPEALNDAIRGAADAIGLDQIDYLLLRNPESAPEWRESGDMGQLKRELVACFQFLEEKTRENQLMGYGVSSDGFALPREASDFFSLEMVLEAVEEALGPLSETGFRLISAPLNVLEPGLVCLDTCAGKSPLDFARARGLGVLTYRPLNAWDGDTWQRLADFPRRGDPAEISVSLREALKESGELENSAPEAFADLRLSHRIARHALPHLSVLLWSSVLSRDAARTSARLEEANPTNADEAEWLRRYRPAIERLLLEVTKLSETLAADVSTEISSRLVRGAPTLASLGSLAPRVSWLVRSTPGVLGVATGLTHPAHVGSLATTPTLPLRPQEVMQAFQFAAEWGEITT